MRSNPQVCLEFDEVISPDQWVSIVVFGRYEELPDTQDYQVARVHAHELRKSAQCGGSLPIFHKNIVTSSTH